MSSFSLTFTFIFMVYLSHLLANANQIPADLVIFQSQPTPTSHYQCVRQQHGDLIMWFLQYENGKISDIQLQSLANAKNAGFKMDIGFSPCRTTSPQINVQ